MRYGEIISKALAITWRHKYLWLLALFAGEGAAGFSFNSSYSSFSGTSSGGSNPGNVSAQQVWNTVSSWISAHALLLVLVGAAYLALLLLGLVIGALTDGALIRASWEYDWQRPFSLGRAWSAGVSTFWPVMKVKLLTLAIGLVWLVVIGGIAALAVAAAVQDAVSTTVTLAIVGTLLALAAIPFYIVFSVVILLLLREVVIRGSRTTRGALGQALGLMRRRLGRVSLLWLLGAALGFAAGIVLTVFTFGSLLLFGGLTYAAYLASGVTAAVVTGILLGLVWLVVVLAASGAVSAFNSTFWTLGYTRLDLDPLPQYAVLPPAAA
jgi:hypothetical protein